MRSGLRFALMLLTAVAAFAQSDRGTITGTISDPAGAVIANAAIEAKNVATGARLSGSEFGNRQLHHRSVAGRNLRDDRHRGGLQEIYPHRTSGGGGRNAAHRRDA